MMPWADMNPVAFWMIALPLFGLVLAAGAAIVERWNR